MKKITGRRCAICTRPIEANHAEPDAERRLMRAIWNRDPNTHYDCAYDGETIPARKSG